MSMRTRFSLPLPKVTHLDDDIGVLGEPVRDHFLGCDDVVKGLVASKFSILRDPGGDQSGSNFGASGKLFRRRWECSLVGVCIDASLSPSWQMSANIVNSRY